MTRNEQSSAKGIDGLSVLAGTIYGIFLGGTFFGGSWIALGLGTLIGLAILSPMFKQMVLITAGIFMGISGIGPPTWTEYHERRGQRIAKILLTLLTVSGVFGLIFAPIK